MSTPTERARAVSGPLTANARLNLILATSEGQAGFLELLNMPLFQALLAACSEDAQPRFIPMDPANNDRAYQQAFSAGAFQVIGKMSNPFLHLVAKEQSEALAKLPRYGADKLAAAE